MSGVQQRVSALADREGSIELDRTPPLFPDDVETGSFDPFKIVCEECGAKIDVSKMSWRKKADEHRDKFGPEHRTFARNWVERIELPAEGEA